MGLLVLGYFNEAVEALHNAVTLLEGKISAPFSSGRHLNRVPPVYMSHLLLLCFLGVVKVIDRITGRNNIE
jgi:hypothetical protein